MNQNINEQMENECYWAFISYSSKDKNWGAWLHKKLESYPIPKEFHDDQVFDGAVLGKNLRPVFRDRDELAGSSELSSAILEALTKSRFLIVLCSPNSAKSEWVNKEIEDFKALCPENENRILALILEGEPNATSRSDVDDHIECFPPALRYPLEPLAGDVRKEGDGKERGFLKVLAGITQLKFDTLYRRHERAQQKRRFFIGSLAIVIMAMLIILSVFAFNQRALAEKNEAVANQKTEEVKEQRDIAKNNEVEAKTQRELAEKALEVSHENQGRFMIEKAELLQKRQKYFDSAMWAAKAIGYQNLGRKEIDADFCERNPLYVKESKLPELYEKALGIAQTNYAMSLNTCIWSSKMTSEHPWGIRTIVQSQCQNFMITGCYYGTVKVWNIKSGELISQVSGEDNPILSLVLGPNNSVIAGYGDGSIVGINFLTGEILKTYKNVHKDGVRSLKYLEKEKCLISACYGGAVQKIKWDTGERVFSTNLNHKIYTLEIVDDQVLCGGDSDKISILNITNGKPTRTLQLDNNKVSQIKLHKKEQKIIILAGKTVEVWSAAKMSRLQKVTIKDCGELRAFDISPDFVNVVYLCGIDNKVIELDLGSGTVKKQHFHPHLNGALAIVALKNKKTIIGSLDGKIIQLDRKEIKQHSGIIGRAKYSKSGELIITTGEEGSIIIRNSRNKKIIRVISTNGTPISAIESSYHGEMICFSSNNLVKLYDVKSKEIKRRETTSPVITIYSLRKEERFVFIHKNGDISINDVDLREIQRVHAHEPGVISSAINQEENLIVTHKQGERIKLWSLLDLKRQPKISPYKPQEDELSLCFNARDETLLITDYSSITSWAYPSTDPTSLTTMRNEGSQPIKSAAISDRSKILSLLHQNGSLFLCYYQSSFSRYNTIYPNIYKNRQGIISSDIHPDEKKILICDNGGTVKEFIIHSGGSSSDEESAKRYNQRFQHHPDHWRLSQDGGSYTLSSDRIIIRDKNDDIRLNLKLNFSIHNAYYRFLHQDSIISIGGHVSSTNIHTKDTIVRKNNKHQIYSYALSEKKGILATGTQGSTIDFWTLPDLVHLSAIDVKSNSIVSLDFDKVGDHVFSLSYTGEVAKWNVERTKIVKRVKIPSVERAIGIHYSNREHKVFVVSSTSKVFVLDPTTLTVQRSMTVDVPKIESTSYDSSSNSLCVSSGRSIVVFSSDAVRRGILEKQKKIYFGRRIEYIDYENGMVYLHYRGANNWSYTAGVNPKKEIKSLNLALYTKHSDCTNHEDAPFLGKSLDENYLQKDEFYYPYEFLYLDEN